MRLGGREQVGGLLVWIDCGGGVGDRKSNDAGLSLKPGSRTLDVAALQLIENTRKCAEERRE